ncbi:hypothetical protein [Nonomuraea jabiensis]|uniref:hypothetical protein n=1 Tax=Nonomuraea jabiensis TaxID=882448 RepID=UPI003D737D74
MTDQDAPRMVMAQATLVGYIIGKLPFLWVDHPDSITIPCTPADQINVIIASTLADGFELVINPQRPTAPPIYSWEVGLDASSMLTVRSPHDRIEGSFVRDLYLLTPPGWREHCCRYGKVIMLVGCGLHLDDLDRLDEHATACARAGLLTSAMVAYTETVGPPR